MVRAESCYTHGYVSWQWKDTDQSLPREEMHGAESRKFPFQIILSQGSHGQSYLSQQPYRTICKKHCQPGPLTRPQCPEFLLELNHIDMVDLWSRATPEWEQIPRSPKPTSLITLLDCLVWSKGSRYTLNRQDIPTTSTSLPRSQGQRQSSLWERWIL